jgi:hypothetical protein
MSTLDKTITPIPVGIQRSRLVKQVSPNGLPIVYAGRPSKWGNPYRVIKKDGYWFVIGDISGVEFSSKDKNEAVQFAVDVYEEYVTHEHNLGNLDITELIDKNISCWCSLDCKCHRDVLLKLAKKLKIQLNFFKK